MGKDGNDGYSLSEGLVPVVAAALGIAAALPAVRWEPLHFDEAITLEYAVRPAAEIVEGVFVDRGGSLLYFFVEHATLSWPGGVEGLRLPNVVSFGLAIGAVWLLCRRLFGPVEGALLAFALASAPLAVSLASFARMYSPFLLLVLVAMLLSERAARVGGKGSWIAAGAATGLLVHVHPIAPLYMAAPLLAAWAVSGLDPRSFARAAWPAAAAAALVAAPYAYALAVLAARYDVRPGGERLATTAGRSVPEEAVRALAPGGALGALAITIAAVAGAGWLARRHGRLAFLLVVWVTTPILFFTVVPAESARFYGRYLLPALPAYLLLAVIGCLALGSRLKGRVPIGAALVAAIVVAGLVDNTRRLDGLRALRLADLVAAVSPPTGVLFASTGTPSSGRPPELLDTYVALERPGVAHVDELPAVDPAYAPDVVQRGTDRVLTFVRAERGGNAGFWILRGPPRRVLLAESRLKGHRSVETRRISPTLLLVTTKDHRPARTLVELGIAVRLRWSIRSPSDRWAHAIVAVDRRALNLVGASPARRSGDDP
jgi:hypothetical protein